MIAFLAIIYVGILVLVFKIFRVRPRPVPIAVAVTVGVLIVVGTAQVWLLAAPFSQKAIVSRRVVEIVPSVKGQVISVPAKPNVPLKKGDVLYEIDPAPYQYAVNQVEAQIKAAKNTVTQFESGVRVAQATFEQAQANASLAKTTLDIDRQVQKENPAAMSQLKIREDEDRYTAAQAGVRQVQASVDQATSGLAAAKDTVVGVQAQLDAAQFNLKECTVKAPTDGFVANWQIREGTHVVSAPIAAAGAFIDTSETAIVATFPAGILVNVRPGQDVELAVKNRPGRLFHGKVDTIIEASGEGQWTTSGKLPSAAAVGSPGFLAVKILLNPDEPANELVMGMPCSVAIYSDWAKSFQIISKVTVRMQKWAYFLPIPDGS